MPVGVAAPPVVELPLTGCGGAATRLPNGKYGESGGYVASSTPVVVPPAPGVPPLPPPGPGPTPGPPAAGPKLPPPLPYVCNTRNRSS